MANPSLGYTQDEQDFDREYEASRKGKNLKELNAELAAAKNPKIKATLQAEKDRIMANRSVKMEDGTVLSGVPPSISDEEARKRYGTKFKSPVAMDEETAQKIGYDIHAARKLGLDDATIREYMKAHPRYRTEQAAKLAAQGMNEPTKALVGFGAGIAETVRGVKQFHAESPWAQPGEKEAARDEQEEARAVDAGLGLPGQVGKMAEKATELTLPGGAAKAVGTEFKIPALIKAGETLVSPGNVGPVERFGGAFAQGSLHGLTQPVGDKGNKVTQALQEGAAGMVSQGAADVAGRVLRPGMGRLNETATELKDLAIKRYQFELPAAVQQGGPVLKKIQAGAETVPGADLNLARMAKKNQTRLNEIAMSSVGTGGKEINPTTLGDAELVIGNKFDQVKAERIRLGPDYIANVSRALADYAKLAKPSKDAMDTLRTFLDIGNLPHAKLIMRGGQQTGVLIPGDVILRNRSALSREAHEAYTGGNWQLGAAKEAIVDAIDDSVEKSLPKNMSGLYGEARKEWKNLMIVEKAYDPKTAGDINPSRLSTALRATYKENYGKIPNGVDELVDAARIAEQFKFKLPDSGTSSRQEGAKLLRLGTAGAGPAVGGAAGYAVGGPPGAVGGAAIGALIPFAAGNALTSSGLGRYLTAPGLSNEQMQLLQLGTRGLGIPGGMRGQ